MQPRCVWAGSAEDLSNLIVAGDGYDYVGGSAETRAVLPGVVQSGTNAFAKDVVFECGKLRMVGQLQDVRMDLTGQSDEGGLRTR